MFTSAPSVKEATRAFHTCASLIIKKCSFLTWPVQQLVEVYCFKWLIEHFFLTCILGPSTIRQVWPSNTSYDRCSVKNKLLRVRKKTCSPTKLWLHAESQACKQCTPNPNEDVHNGSYHVFVKCVRSRWCRICSTRVLARLCGCQVSYHPGYRCSCQDTWAPCLQALAPHVSIFMAI